jgi:multiple sugar transport system substrate-binding protein
MLVGREQYAAMTIHHIGSTKQLTQELGDSITAVPVPCGPAGKAWSTYGDGSNAIFANCVNPEAAWQWISYLSSAPANVAFNKLAGQMTVTTSGAKDWNLHPKRFVDATTQPLASGRTLPLVEQTADFVRTIWPQTNQEELLGQAAPQMFIGENGIDWGLLMAGGTLVGLPATVLLLLVQRKLVGGLTAGPVKG